MRESAFCRMMAFAVVAALLLLIAGCGDDENPCSPTPQVYTFSFESSLDGWSAKAIDTDSPPIEWSIEQSSDRATDGTRSVKLYLENFNDKGKIWVERGFTVEPHANYRVAISFDFATSDWGQANLFQLIAGAIAKPAETFSDLVFQGSTGNGADYDAGFLWLDKHYELEVTSGESGMVYAIIGVWGTWETPRTYYVDRVRIEITKT